MKVGLLLPLFSGDPERVLSFARHAEELGFHGLFAFDHFFPPGAPPSRPSLEAFATLSAVAAATRAPKVGTLVARASLRRAGVLAKLATTIDDVSGGRMILGIGTGDRISEPEHEAFGVRVLDTTERREQLVETVTAVRALFRGDRWEGGRHVEPAAGPLLPPPKTVGGPPIWMGGRADTVVRLAARHADGWNGWGMEADAFVRTVKLLRDEAKEAGRTVEATWGGIAAVGRDQDDVEALLRVRERKGLDTRIWAGTAVALGEFLGGLGDEGATWAVLAPDAADQIDLIAEQVLPRLTR